MRRPNDFLHDSVVFTVAHAALTATTAQKLFKATRTFRVDAIRYVNPTGLAADGTNAFAMVIKNGSTEIASVFNTDSGDVGGAALAANTFVDAVFGADPLPTLAAGDELIATFTEDGTATLPAGVIQVEGRYL